MLTLSVCSWQSYHVIASLSNTLTKFPELHCAFEAQQVQGSCLDMTSIADIKII